MNFICNKNKKSNDKKIEGFLSALTMDGVSVMKRGSGKHLKYRK